MNWRSYEVWSDFVGLVSAMVMVYPAWRDDWVGKLIHTLGGERPPDADPNAAKARAKAQARLGTWSTRDRFFLRIGVGLLAASFSLKMCHHMGWTLDWFPAPW